MGASEIKPRLFIVRETVEKGNGDFSQQYQSITDHLIKVIRKDGRLDLQQINTDKHDFSNAVTGIREKPDFKDRPFAFLFIKPSPANQKSLDQSINDLADIADSSMLNPQTGAEDPALASSVLFFNQQEFTKNNPSTYQDDLEIFKTIDFNEGNSLEIISDNLSNFRNLFTGKSKLNQEIETYAKGLIDHVLAIHQAKSSDQTNTGDQIKLGDKDTVGKLNDAQQRQIYSIDWQEQIDENPKDTRFKVMNRIMEEATVQDIAAQFKINASQINQILNAFFSDPKGFITN